MSSRQFATAINCMDGRTQNPVSDWVRSNHSVEYVDMITEPGCDKVISEKNIDLIEQIKSKVEISVNAHKSSLVVVAGHYGCAANVATKEMHIKQIQKSVNIVKSWNLPIQVIGLWVNEEWKIEQV